MATYKEYQCKHCNYTVDANPDGHDLTMMGESYSFLCKDCREIVNILTFPLGKKAEKVICPECGSENLTLWNPVSGKCPRCGGERNHRDRFLIPVQ